MLFVLVEAWLLLVAELLVVLADSLALDDADDSLVTGLLVLVLALVSLLLLLLLALDPAISTPLLDADPISNPSEPLSEPSELSDPLALSFAVIAEHATNNGSISCDWSNRPVVGMAQSVVFITRSSRSRTRQESVVQILVSWATVGAVVSVAMDTPEPVVQAVNSELLTSDVIKAVEQFSPCASEANAASAAPKIVRLCILLLWL